MTEAATPVYFNRRSRVVVANRRL